MSNRDLSESEILAQIPKARARAQRFRATEPHAKAVRFDAARRTLHVVLTNGASLSVPVRLLGALRSASAKDLSVVRVGPAGVGLRWERLDTDLSVAHLASTALGQSTLLRAAGAVGGASRSRAKVLAARSNGKKGGRPRKAEGAA